VNVLRNENKKSLSVKLKNQFGKFKYGNSDFSNYFIGELKPITKSDANRFEINYGVKIENLKNRNLNRIYGIESGDIILAVEEQKVHSANDVEQLLKKHQNKDYVEIQVLTQDGKMGYIKLREN